MKQTNCPNCGATITGPRCEYCGTAFEDYKVITKITGADGEKIVEEYSGNDAISFAQTLSELAAKSGIPMKQATPYILPNPVAASNSLKMVMQKIDDNSAEKKEREWPILKPEEYSFSLPRESMTKEFERLGKNFDKQFKREEKRKRRHARLLKVKSLFRGKKK